MTHLYSKETLEEDTIRILKQLTSSDKIKRLEKVLTKYLDIILMYKDYGLYPNVLIVDTFLFNKHFTSIDVANIEPKRVAQFIEDLEEFFFVNYDYIEVHISRFKTLGKVALGEMKIEGEKVRLSDRYADLAGLFYGYPPKLIVQYCLKKSKDHLIKQ